MKNFRLFILFLVVVFSGFGAVFAWQPNIGFKRVLPPYGLTYSSMSPSYTKYTTITNNTPSLPGGSPAPTSWAISPALPAGLSFNTSTGIISGTPTSSAYTGAHVVTASNGGGSVTATLNITIVIPVYTWVGNAFPDTSWTTAANWSGGSVPNSNSAGIDVYFDNECGSHCNATISSAVAMRRLYMKSTYTGTLTQATGAGNTITMGTNTWASRAGWTMDGGTFVGGTGNIRTDFFYLLGGSFTSTAGELRFGTFTSSATNLVDGFNVGAAATFAHNNGTVYQQSSVGSAGIRTCDTFFLDQAVSFYNLTFNCEDTTGGADGYNGGYFVIGGSSGVMNVYNSFTFADGNSWQGTINFYGANAYFACDGMATRRYCVRAHYAVASYNWVTNLTRFVFTGASAQTFTYDDGATAPFNFDINNASGVSTPTLSGRFGLMRLNINNGTFTAPAGELNFIDDFPMGTSQPGAGLTVTSPGVFSPNGGTVSIEGKTTSDDQKTFFVGTSDTNILNFYNLTLNMTGDTDANAAGREMTSATFTSGMTVNIAGDLRVKNGRFREYPTGGGPFNFYITGNYYRQCANYATHDCADTDFKANKRFVGPSSQIYIDNPKEADCASCTITIAAGAGNTVTVNNIWNLRNSIAGTENLTVTSGTLNVVTGAGIFLGGNLINNSAVTCAGTGILQYFGSLSGSPGGGNNAACYTTTPPDATASAVDWVNFSGTSASQAVSGVSLGVNLQISRANVSGTPTCQYRQNGGEDGAWTTVPNGGSVNTQVINGDGLEFIATGTTGQSCTFTIQNVSDSNTVIDTVTGTVP